MTIRIKEKKSIDGVDCEYIFYDKLPKSVMDAAIEKIKDCLESNSTDCIVEKFGCAKEYQVRSLYNEKDLTIIDNEVKIRTVEQWRLDISSILKKETKQLQDSIDSNLEKFKSYLQKKEDSDLGKKEILESLNCLKTNFEELQKIKNLKGE